LGISHLYASPFLTARAGSTHGYDIVDHTRLNPELGGEEGFARLSQALAEADLGLILDFVPNHMAVHRADNAWWLDVLEWGERSPYARFVDIAWATLPVRPEGGVLLPIRPSRYGDILRTVVAAAHAEESAAGRRLLDVASLYPDPRAPLRERAPAYKAALAAVEGGGEVIERGLAAYRASPDDAAAVLALHRLLERQHYRLAHWRVAASEVNYRRFFDINELAGLRVEDMRVFTAVHHLVAGLIAEGRLHGLRLDHIDGLQNPAQYAERLQRLVRRVRPGGRGRLPFYTGVEKILGEGEARPRFPGVAGTTGYEWLNTISRLLLDERGMPVLVKTAQDLIGSDLPFEEIVQQSKRRVLETMLASEFTVLARLLARVAAGHWRTRDFTFDRLSAALQLYVLNFPVYRTYVTPEGACANDRATIARTIEAARAQWFGPDAAIFDLLQDALTLDLIAPERQGYSQQRVQRFAFKVQQFTGPLMAKSLEDTAFYRYFALLALNEVGGDPILPALSAPEFHARMAAQAKDTPHGLVATATHDTKRGEDARARLLALSELADEWAAEAERWSKLNASLVTQAGGRRAPSRAHEYMLYQALVGAWPLEAPDERLAVRMQAYAVKAAREGKLETSWMNPNEVYEQALTKFVGNLLDRGRSAPFIEALSAVSRRIALLGALNGLVQLTLKATMPGVPDFYQGTEFWDLSLVDPDNRRPVDFAARANALAALETEGAWGHLAESWSDGRIKLALTHRLRSLRRTLAHVFTGGDYAPLPVSGRDADHIIAFARQRGGDGVLVIAARHFARFTEGGRRWLAFSGEASVDLGDWERVEAGLCKDGVAIGRNVNVAELMSDLPVIVLRATRSLAAPSRRQRASRSSEQPGTSLR
jgi:(1->4)-alpha-D-glucan 1-alpha-D-glucosylmutase